jgi:hypothetical protein
LELLWRWMVGIPTLAVCAWEASRISHTVTINLAALQAMTVFKPVQAAATLATTVRGLAPAVLPVLLWLVPLALLLRTAAAAVGRATLLRRLDAQAHPRRRVLFVLSLLRAGVLLLVLALWLEGVRWANGFAIMDPASRGAEPNLVLLCALVVFGTLALFMLWASSIWVLDAGIILAGVHEGGVLASIRGALRLGQARSKFVEINLVMGIVKVELIVLTMVFSSCPLPFESVESQTFLAWWWAGVIVLYFLGSNFFHVVRTAAYLALYRAYEPRPEPGDGTLTSWTRTDRQP